MSIPPIWAYAPNCVQREYVVGFNLTSKYIYVYIYILGSSCDIWVRLETQNTPGKKCWKTTILKQTHLYWSVEGAVSLVLVPQDVSLPTIITILTDMTVAEILLFRVSAGCSAMSWSPEIRSLCALPSRLCLSICTLEIHGDHRVIKCDKQSKQV